MRHDLFVCFFLARISVLCPDSSYIQIVEDSNPLTEKNVRLANRPLKRYDPPTGSSVSDKHCTPASSKNRDDGNQSKNGSDVDMLNSNDEN